MSPTAVKRCAGFSLMHDKHFNSLHFPHVHLRNSLRNKFPGTINWDVRNFDIFQPVDTRNSILNLDFHMIA